MRPKAPPRIRRKFLTREEAERAIAACALTGTETPAEKDQKEALEFILYCGVHAGMRKGEVVAAKADWFDTKAKLLHIQNTEEFLIKDRDDRTVPLSEPFLAFSNATACGSPTCSKRCGRPRRNERQCRGFRAEYDLCLRIAEDRRAKPSLSA